MSDLPPEIEVVVEPPLPDVQAVVEPPLPDVSVVVSEVGLVGPPGPQGAPGRDGVVITPDGSSVVTSDELNAHIFDDEPHPTYDDGTSFILRYLNAKV